MPDHKVAPRLPDLQGHWKRRWIERGGTMDAPAHAHWFQAGAHFVDVRIPVANEILDDATGLMDAGPDQLRSLLASKGFAGTITLEGATCTWHRHMDWQGLSGDADCGLLALERQGVLMEVGLDQAYSECWDHVSNAQLRVYRCVRGPVSILLITGEDVFGLGCARAPDAKRQIARSHLLSGRIQSGWIEAVFADEYASGRWKVSNGILDHCTNPFRRGQAALHRSPDGTMTYFHRDADQTTTAFVLKEIEL